ncbi:olfactory receptor 51G2-like isoform X2 [Rhinatrema bivittatum]|uniref:olfactory receptor 51G2-like isoform X2 n=1 Tax=Rhinatrema bivittatum TaxID=194408 RepID=UPI00112D6CFE|nr:olfactory receptor 51G2-like isoform X2 [Rhinatrema bivittatum]
MSSSLSAHCFILLGIPGLEAQHIWISILFCAAYAIALLGNCFILFLIKTERSLHTPMYYFLSMLALYDIGLSLTTLPTILSIFWFNSQEINFDACLVQMFFLQTFSLMESSVLLAMAFDRFIAICNPLRYASILTNSTIAKIGVAIVVRIVALEIPLTLLLKRLPFCKSNSLSHSFCFHPDIMKLACADTRINSIYGLFAVLSTTGIDSVFIFLSYMAIMKTVLNIARQEERLKAFNTCVPHICAVLIFYILIIGLSVVHRLGKNVPLVIYSLVGNICFLSPPVLNPVIYCIKTKQIQRAVVKIFITTRQDQR